MSESLVLVTAATSYIGSHCINLLLQEGWRVRGTVRKLSSDKTKALQECFEPYKDRLELVEADISIPEGWDAVCQGCTHAMHLACPVSLTPNIEEVITGTLLVINAAKKAGIKRLVMTSSIAAMIPAGWCEPLYPVPNVTGAFDPNAHLKTISEETWTDVKLTDGYLIAKTRSEQEAWKAVEGSSMEMATVNPAYVFGPPLHKAMSGESLLFVDLGMRQGEHSVPSIPSTRLACIDVRDVARAHLKAMILPEAAGQRYLGVTSVLDAWDIQDLLKEKFAPMGYNVLTSKIGKCFTGIMGCCREPMARVYRNWGRYPTVDNSKIRKLLPEMIDMNTSIVESVLASIAIGRYPRLPGFKTDKPEFQGKTGHLSLQVKL